MTEEQTAFLQKATRSVEAARTLAQEGHIDIAISRAYYAMFYAAEAALLGEGLKFSSHKATVSAFAVRFTQAGRLPKELHRHLIEAHQARQLADYDSHTDLTAEDAENHMIRAERFITEVSKAIA